MSELTISVPVVAVACCTCGLSFLIPASLSASLRATGREFFCPSGHKQSYKNSLLSKSKEETERWKEKAKALGDELKTLKRSLRNKEEGKKLNLDGPTKRELVLAALAQHPGLTANELCSQVKGVGAATVRSILSVEARGHRINRSGSPFRYYPRTEDES